MDKRTAIAGSINQAHSTYTHGQGVVLSDCYCLFIADRIIADLDKPDNKIHVTADDLLQIWLHKKQPHEFMPDGEPSIALDKTEKKYCECEEPNRIIKTYMECRGCGKSIKSSRSME